MKNLLKYILIGLGLIFLATVIAPMVIGLLIGGAIAYGGMKLFNSAESKIMKALGLMIILVGVIIAFSSIPVLLVLATALVGYYVYKHFKENDQLSKTTSPFQNFEKEWKNIKK